MVIHLYSLLKIYKIKIYKYTEEDAKQILALQNQLQHLSSQLALLTEKRNKRKARKRSSIGGTKSSKAAMGAAAHHSTKKQYGEGYDKKRRREESDDDLPETAEITYEMKRELSENINLLDQDKLPIVFDLIKENTDLKDVIILLFNIIGYWTR